MNPKPEEVRAQFERLCETRHFRGIKLRRILHFVVEEWLTDGGKNLTEKFIGDALGDEPITFEQHSDKVGYPKTRANIAHVRNRLKAHYETEGYRDPVIIKLNPGSYAPVIALNPVSKRIPEIEPAIERLILRAKIAIDTRTLRGALRAIDYYLQIPGASGNPRQEANVCFIPMAIATIIPGFAAEARPATEAAIARIKASGVEPWECMFAEAAIEACHRHDWEKSLDLFGSAVESSQGEAKYFWWYTALLASKGRVQAAIEILDAAVRHFSRTSIAVRTDLALLQTMAGQFEETEELLSASLDFTLESNVRITFSLMVLFEAQDRMEDAVTVIMRLGEIMQVDAATSVLVAAESVRAGEPPSSSLIERMLSVSDGHVLLGGMFALIMARIGETALASELVGLLLRLKAKHPETSSIEIAIGMIGLQQFDDAVAWLRKAAFEESDPFTMWFHIFPPLRHLREHRGYRQLLKDLGLTRQGVR